MSFLFQEIVLANRETDSPDQFSWSRYNSPIGAPAPSIAFSPTRYNFNDEAALADPDDFDMSSDGFILRNPDFDDTVEDPTYVPGAATSDSETTNTPPPSSPDFEPSPGSSQDWPTADLELANVQDDLLQLLESIKQHPPFVASSVSSILFLLYTVI